MVRLGSGFVVEFHSLLRAEVDTGKALGAVTATQGFAIIGKCNVSLWTHLCTDAAAHTSVTVNHRGQHGQSAALHGWNGTQGTGRTPPGKVAAMNTCGNVGSNLLKPSSIAIELPNLVVWVASKADGAAVGHTYFMAVSNIDTLGCQNPTHTPNSIARLGATGDNDENVCLLGQPKAGYQFRHRTRRIEPIAGKHQTDTVFLRQVKVHRLAKRHHVLIEFLCQLATDGKAVARA